MSAKTVVKKAKGIKKAIDPKALNLVRRVCEALTESNAATIELMHLVLRYEGVNVDEVGALLERCNVARFGGVQ